MSGEPSLVPGLPNPSCPGAESRALHSADLQGGWGLHRGQGPTRPLPPAASPPSTATGTLSIEILEVNDHAPELSPPWGSLCSTPDRGSGLLLGATDEDLPPHGAPFHFQLSPRVPELARNWSLSQVNGEPPTHTPGVQSLGEVPAGATSVHPQARQGLVIRLRKRMGKPRPSMPGAPSSRLLPSARTQRGTAAPGPCLTASALRSEPRAPAAEAPGPGGAAPPQPAAPGLRTAAPAARAAPERDRVPLRPGRRLPAWSRCTAGRWRGHQPRCPGHHAGQRYPAAL